MSLDNATFTDTDFAKSVDYYYYGQQLRSLQLQFAAIFTEMNVSTGKNGKEMQTKLISVPVKMASKDRVVAALKSNNNQNTPLRLPVIGIQMVGLEFAYERFKGLGTQTRKTTFKRGGTLPDNGEVVYKKTPMPYFVDFEVSILTSNQLHMHEILEQIMLLFTPDIQLQTSDTYLDWAAITNAELLGIQYDVMNEGTDTEPYNATLSFRAVGYISAPANIRKNYIKKICIRLDSIRTGDNFTDYFLDNENEYDTIIDVNKLNIPPK